MIIDNKVVTTDDLAFVLAQTPMVSQWLEKEDTDDNVLAFINDIQNYSTDFLGDGNNVTEKAKRYDNIVYELSAL